MRPSSPRAVTPAAVVSSSMNVPVDPSMERCTSKPVSLAELSCQETSIRLSDAATTWVLDGAFSPRGANVVAEAKSERWDKRGRRTAAYIARPVKQYRVGGGSLR